jgi:hypothetical protein
MTTSKALLLVLGIGWGFAAGYFTGSKDADHLTKQLADTTEVLTYQTTNTIPLVTFAAATAGWSYATQGYSLIELTNKINEISKTKYP